MLKEEGILGAEDLLWQHYQAGTVLAELPENLRPATRAEAYAVQSCILRRTNRPLYGWKIAATSAAGQRHINVEGPQAGRILAERVVADGSEVRLGANRMRVAETEFAFRMGASLPARATAYTQAEVLAAIDTLHPAIEVPDSRYADFTKVGEAQLIADNACAHLFMLGPPAADSWRALDLAAHPVVGTIAGRAIRHEGQGANVLGGPLIALTWLVNELSRIRVGLRAGQVVTTGTAATPLPLQPGDEAVADFGPLGQASLRFA